MKKITYFSLAFATLTLTACANTAHKTDLKPKVGMANPASQYCIDQGGKIEIKTDASGGQVGYCQLSNGQVVEEWAFFRESQANCLPEEAQKLVGQTGLTDAQIQQKTQSSMIRTVAPGQPVTMDYRANRITVTIDSTSKKITNAACG
ncbi:I78 family peptidase inhibitor [Acinetobacter silvestris]|uniref:Hemolysin n=1 Tax=Acinetobacter silvestris TaxID=1977882 RepID=A0A1Y3CL74_9GAMM|nr:I78 family peptidase inhibitor [Acinetobacter silvestris]OTG66372.1 hemolysin [Acinetobacter silvestris]